MALQDQPEPPDTWDMKEIYMRLFIGCMLVNIWFILAAFPIGCLYWIVGTSALAWYLTTGPGSLTVTSALRIIAAWPAYGALALLMQHIPELKHLSFDQLVHHEWFRDITRLSPKQ